MWKESVSKRWDKNDVVENPLVKLVRNQAEMLVTAEKIKKENGYVLVLIAIFFWGVF